MIPNELFYQRVSYQPCNMAAIDPELKDFDFNWSSCCFEHLGSIEAGIQFVINAVERTLKIGGIACHTTELNLSSDTDTIEEGETVLYRRRDILDLINRLTERGHEVTPLIVGQNIHHLDNHVDIPPYSKQPHLKIRMGEYVTTSVGITVRRGK